nr:hypothetical protein [Tanacetum cinerariifolium]
MMLESVENGPLIWPTIEENGVTRTKKYAELSVAEKIQADCDMKATNIILQDKKETINDSSINQEAAFSKIKTSVQSLNPEIAYPGRFPTRWMIVKPN